MSYIPSVAVNHLAIKYFMFTLHVTMKDYICEIIVDVNKAQQVFGNAVKSLQRIFRSRNKQVWFELI